VSISSVNKYNHINMSSLPRRIAPVLNNEIVYLNVIGYGKKLKYRVSLDYSLFEVLRMFCRSCYADLNDFSFEIERKDILVECHDTPRSLGLINNDNIVLIVN
jgi:hypothetical protein